MFEVVGECRAKQIVDTAMLEEGRVIILSTEGLHTQFGKYTDKHLGYIRIHSKAMG